MLSTSLHILSTEDVVFEHNALMLFFSEKHECWEPLVHRQSSLPVIVRVQVCSGLAAGSGTIRLRLRQEQPASLLSRLAPVLVIRVDTRIQHLAPQHHSLALKPQRKSDDDPVCSNYWFQPRHKYLLSVCSGQGIKCTKARNASKSSPFSGENRPLTLPTPGYYGWPTRWSLAVLHPLHPKRQRLGETM